MKVLYFTNAPFSDLEISFVNELEKLVDVKVLMMVLPNTRKSGALSLDRQPDELDIIPAAKYPGMQKYAHMLTIEHWSIVNNPIGSTMKTSLILAKKITQVVEEYQPDILHTTFYGLLQAYIGRHVDKNIKKVITIHDVVPHSRQSFVRHCYERISRRITLQNFNNILLLSHVDVDILERELHHTAHQIFFSKLGPYTYLRNYPATSNPYGKYILFFGNIRAYKGVDILIDAYKDSVCTNHGVKLVIAGKDDEKILHDDYGKDIVILNRYIENDELATLIANSLFVVLPYKSATQSGVTKSAIALHKPMLCTSVGNLPNEVINGKYGKIVSPNDIDSLCQGINYMIENPQHVESFSQNIASDFESGENSWKDITENVVKNVYNIILSYSSL